VLNHAAADFDALFTEGGECARRLFGEALVPGVLAAG
jgi:hypothetical protein